MSEALSDPTVLSNVERMFTSGSNLCYAIAGIIGLTVLVELKELIFNKPAPVCHWSQRSGDE